MTSSSSPEPPAPRPGDQRGDPASVPPPDPGGGVRIARVFGVPVYVAPSWFVVAAVITLLLAPRIAQRVPGPGAYAVALVFTLLLYGSVLVHEMSHTFVALRFGLPVRRMVLYLLGGVSEIEREPETPRREFLVAVVGPVVSLALAGLAWAVGQLLEPGSVARFLVEGLAGTNLVVGVFNLLPGLPLDGGRVLLAGVWRATGRRLSGTVAASYGGRAVAVLLVAWTLLPLLRGDRPSLFSVAWGLVLASFLWSASGQALAVARVRDRLPSIRARALARRALPVPAATPLAEGLRRAREAGARGLVVVDDAGVPVGVVSEAAVVATPEHRRPWVDVASVSRRLEQGLVLPADLAGEELVGALQRTPGSEYLLVEDDGSPAGILAAGDVQRAFAPGAR